MMTLVETLVSRQLPVHGPENRPQAAAGALSDISSIHSMEVDEGGAPIRNPKAENYVPKMPLLDGSKMSKGRRSEIETWVDYLEVFLPWIALFDDRIPSEVQKYLTRDTAILNNSLPKGESIRSTRLFLYLRQSFSNYPRGLDILKQIEREQLGVSAGYEAMRRLHQDLSVCSRIEASTLREEVLRYSPPKITKERPLDVFRNVQVELAKYARLISGFPDLFLSEADQSMIVLKNLDVEVKRYILLHAKIDNMVELERAIKFYDANIKFLNFAEKGKEHANPLLFEEKGKGKGKEKGKEKGKQGDKEQGKEKGKGKEKQGEKGKGKEKGKSSNGKGKGEDKSSGSNQPEKPKDPNKYAHIKCYNCNEMGHFSNKCPKPKVAKANVALLEPQLAGAALVEPQLFAVVLDVPPGCAVYSMCEDDSSSECLSDDDPGLALMFEHAFGVETEDELGVELESLCESSCGEVGLVELQRTSSQQSREDPVVLEDPVELVLVNSRSIMLEGTPIQQSGEDPVVLEDPVELASLDRILHDDTPEAEFCHVFHECEESVDFESCLGDSDVGDLVELAVDVDMCAAVTRSKQSNTEVAGAASDAMWWLVDSGASTHLINEETLQGVRVVSQTEHAGVDCVTATGASVGIRKSAVVQVEFRLDDPEGQTVLVELEVLVAPVRLNLLSLGRLLDRSWDVQFVPEFCVKAAKFSFLTRWKQNCGWLLSVPSVSSSASSVLGSQAPCGDGREGGGKQPVFSVDRGREREGGHHSEQHGAGVGLRGRALRGHRDHKRADQEDPCSKGGSQGTPKSAQCSSEGASQQQYRASGKEDAEEDRGPETTQDGPNAVASEVLCREETEQPQKGHLEALQGQDPCPPLCQARRAPHFQCPGARDGSQAGSQGGSEAKPLGPPRKSPASMHVGAGDAEARGLQPVAALDRGIRGRQLHEHLLCREANGHDGVEDSRVWDERSSPRRHRQGLLLQDPRASEGSSKEEASYPAKATSAGRSTDDPTTNTEDINYSEDAGNRQQGLFARGSSGDRVACFVAVPRHGLKKQEARSITSPHDTATTSTTIDSPTSSSVVLGKSPRRVVLEKKRCLVVLVVSLLTMLTMLSMLSLVALTCMLSMMLAWLLVTCRSFRTQPRTPRHGC